MTKLSLTHHARITLAEREIEIEWVERVIAEPERMEMDIADTSLTRVWRRIPEFGGRWLRVVFRKRAEDHQIITVYFDRGVGRTR